MDWVTGLTFELVSHELQPVMKLGHMPEAYLT